MPLKPPQTPEEWNEYDAAHRGADPLAEAQIALQNANKFGAENNSARLAALPESLAGLQAASDHRGIGRKTTEGLATVGKGLGYGSLGSAFVGAAPLAAGLGVASSAAMLPDYLRRLVAPDANEERPGAMESALTALPLAPKVLGSLRGLKGAAKTAGDTTDELRSAWQAGTEMPYRAGGSVTAPEDVVSTAGSVLPDSWKQFAGAPTPKAPYAQPPFTKLPKGLDYVADTLGPLDSHAGGGVSQAATQSTKTRVPSGGLRGLQNANKPYVSEEYGDELGRAMRGDAPPFSETGTRVPGPMYHPSNDISGKWGGDGKGYEDLTGEMEALVGQPHSQGLNNMLHQQEALSEQADPRLSAREALSILKRLADKGGWAQ